MLPTLPALRQTASPIGPRALAAATHTLVVLPPGKTLDALREAAGAVPALDSLALWMKRRGTKAGELAKTPVAGSLPNGGLVSFITLDPRQTRFEQHTALRKGLQPLLDEHPGHLTIAVCGNPEQRRLAAEQALYVAWVNSLPLPTRGRKKTKPVAGIRLYGARDARGFARVAALARGNLLARTLTVMPPNELTPGVYRRALRGLAQKLRLRHEEFGFARLKRMGAGAFCAVAQGSEPQDAAIVHLSWRHPSAKRSVALVGKGICFDTGGHNLKDAKGMHGMHEDMNGSAVALATLVAARILELPLQLDCWLALAQNHIGPKSYKQNDVVKALDGTSIEIMHTDAEGRMVLADTLALAAGKEPALMIDFATLTGVMVYALGNRYCGIFASSDELAAQAVAAGRASGERVAVFPLDEDYDAALESKVADLRQCLIAGEADAILAARFLKRFTHEVPWLHLDLSAHTCVGGLGAVATDVTGFGVAWALALLDAPARGVK